ncbi:MAG: transposase domain-containing protein [Bacteroidaceae bacterium]|nr:transposase domain-containing protein [Bacteroidaceae bacterium]
MLTDSNRYHYSDMTRKALVYVTSNTLIETCKNVGLNVKEYFTYVFSRLIEGEKDYEKLLPSAVAR